jgi:predicted flap endonuclease-1-like 5' DNA nuclease
VGASFFYDNDIFRNILLKTLFHKTQLARKTSLIKSKLKVMTNLWCNILPILTGLIGAVLGGWYIYYQRTQELSTELEELQSQNASLMQAHDTLTVQSDTLNIAFTSLTEKHRRLGAENTNLQIAFAEYRSETPLSVPETVDNSALDSKISALESELAAVNAEYTEYRNSMESRVRVAEGQLIALKGQYEKMLDSYIEQGQYIKSLKGNTQTTSLHTEAFRAEKRADEARISHLEIELAEVTTAYALVKNEENTRNQQLSEQYETMLGKYQQQGQQLKNLAEEVSEWQSHYESLMLKKNNQDTLILEFEEKRSHYDKETALLRGQVAMLRGQVSMQQKTAKLLESELADWNTKYAELETEKAEINATLTTINSSYSTGNWELKYNDLESRYSSLTRRIQDLNQSNERMEKTIVELNGEILTYKRRINPDDLKLIEGIGPKIEELLNNEGIYKYEQLATTNVDMIRAILDKAGSRFRMHDPQSWASQADIADKGDWVKLKEFQEYLIGGRQKEQPFVAVASR